MDMSTKHLVSTMKGVPSIEISPTYCVLLLVTSLDGSYLVTKGIIPGEDEMLISSWMETLGNGEELMETQS